MNCTAYAFDACFEPSARVCINVRRFQKVPSCQRANNQGSRVCRVLRRSTQTFQQRRPGQPAQRRTCKLSAAPPGAAGVAAEPGGEVSLTQRVFEEIAKRNSQAGQASGAGGGTTYEALKRVDALWADVRKPAPPRPAGPDFVREDPRPLGRAPEYDAVVCGGTLGVFIAAALQLKGQRVAVVERGPLRGREQDWNVSRGELMEVVELGLLTREEAEACISIEFNPVRIGFHGMPQEVWTRDVLNLGVSPAKLIEKVRQRFVEAGGTVLDKTDLKGITIHPDGAALDTAPVGAPASNGAAEQKKQVTSRLVLDCMGGFSPAVRQLRGGRKPDGVCLVVGSCSRGFTDNDTSDLIYTVGPIQPPDASGNNTGNGTENGMGGEGGGGGGHSGARLPFTQLFWEAFPAASHPTDRTTYMFTYTDADPSRPSLETMLDEYWELMPKYQGVRLEDLEVQRVLFGIFTTYRDSPLQTPFARLLPVGDASGIQSPLSFGGFAALTRHLGRLQGALSEALEADALDASSLNLVNSYNPALSGAWMMQRAMSVRPGQKPDPQFINSLMGANFAAMQDLGEPVMRPFLQDVVQFGPLARTMGAMLTKDPASIPAIMAHVGPGPLADWMAHFVALGAYTALAKVAAPATLAAAERLPPRQRYALRRRADAWRYGAGADYSLTLPAVTPTK